ncbi:MAG: fibronectin type III domain-containing protein [Gammaproteobacteria bacterium]
MTGTGLVILNNGKAVNISNNAFSVSLASGSSYAFTVDTQPNNPAQLCTISNGSGTVGSANITNVTVSCSTLSYTISGTISGLAGSGLVILNNGTPVTVTNNAFSVTQLSGSSYAFTVGTQPSNPAQLCTIANGTGTVDSSNITNVAVSCATSITPSYTVSGTISGLAGSGLVILNNGTAVAVSNNAFSVTLASGSSYAFTIGAQPSSPTQQCTISNGSGTVGTTNITNVAVSCSTLSYTVSGTISGLTGSGLVILNNGTPVTVTNNAFSVSLASGSTYAFTIGTQPSSPTQQCAIINGTGTVGSANISNVAVACSTLSYTVSGTISGLTGSGLVILNNGSPVTVTNNAFSVTLLSGSTYAFTVGTQPSSPTQQCTIANGSGTVGSANISNVAVSCSTTTTTGSVTLNWSAPTTRADGTAISLSDISGYILYYGTSPTTTSSNAITINDGSATQYTLTLPAGTYYFVICAVDSNGMPGAMSTVLQKTL